MIKRTLWIAAIAVMAAGSGCQTCNTGGGCASGDCSTMASCGCGGGRGAGGIAGGLFGGGCKSGACGGGQAMGGRMMASGHAMGGGHVGGGQAMGGGHIGGGQAMGGGQAGRGGMAARGCGGNGRCNGRCGGGNCGGLMANMGQGAPARVGTLPLHQNPDDFQRGPQSGTYAYPWYTTLGPRDFLHPNPPSIGR